MPLCLASRAKSMASIERGMLSGSVCAWMSITPLKLDCPRAGRASRLKQNAIQRIRLSGRYEKCERIEISFSVFCVRNTAPNRQVYHVALGKDSSSAGVQLVSFSKPAQAQLPRLDRAAHSRFTLPGGESHTIASAGSRA